MQRGRKKKKKKRKSRHEVRPAGDRRVPGAAPADAVDRPVDRGTGGARHVEEAQRHRAEVEYQRGGGGGGRRRGYGERLRAAPGAQRPARHHPEAGAGVRPDLREDR